MVRLSGVGTRRVHFLGMLRVPLILSLAPQDTVASLLRHILSSHKVVLDIHASFYSFTDVLFPPTLVHSDIHGNPCERRFLDALLAQQSGSALKN